AEVTAQAHLKDLAIQDRYGVKFLTYWFDEARGTAFCLVQSPDKETANCVHREAHGGVANTMVEVELWAVEACLGRVTDPGAPAIQGAFADFNRSSSEPIRVRIGLHAGEPVEDSNDLFGAAVQMAARLCQAAEPDTIVASGEVRAACADDTGWIALGESRLK